jgi:hypothetical protein
MVYEKTRRKQLTLDLNFDQTPPQVQYQLNLADRNLVTDNHKNDYMIRRYLQVPNLNLPTVCPEHREESRKDLNGLEPGADYYEVKEFYLKHTLLNSLPVPADDVLIARGTAPAKMLPRWNSYTAVVNWYIDNQTTIYQHIEEQEVIDQFIPDNLTLWIISLEYDWTVQSLDQFDRPRTWISWLYKPNTFNQLLANWTSHNK